MDFINRVLRVFLLLTLSVCCHADDDTPPCRISTGEAMKLLGCSNITDFSAATAAFTDEQLTQVDRVFILNSSDLVLARADFEKPGYVNLKRIDLVLNNITDINVEPLRGLQLIWLSYEYNNLTTINDNAFAGLSSLQVLILNYNQIESLSAGAFQGLNNLRSIDLSDNEIRTLHSETFRNTPDLYKLELYSNKLESLPSGLFDTNLNFTSLDLIFNDLENLSNFPLQSPSITTLNLGFCNIHTIPEGYFNQLPNLELLNLASNKISELGPNVFPQTSLRYILLNNNKLTSLSVNSFAPFLRIYQQYTKNVAEKGREQRFKVILRDNPWDCTTSDMVDLRAQIDLLGPFDDVFNCTTVE